MFSKQNSYYTIPDSDTGKREINLIRYWLLDFKNIQPCNTVTYTNATFKVYILFVNAKHISLKSVHSE